MKSSAFLLTCISSSSSSNSSSRYRHLLTSLPHGSQLVLTGLSHALQCYHESLHRVSDSLLLPCHRGSLMQPCMWGSTIQPLHSRHFLC